MYDRGASLFGDGAGAALLSAGPAPADGKLPAPLFATHTVPSPALYHPTHYTEENNAIEGYMAGEDRSTLPRPIPTMDGKGSLRLALGTLEDVDRVLEMAHERYGIGREDINAFVPHQTNIHVIKKFCQHVGVAFEEIPYTLEQYGGISTAGIPTGLAEHHAAGKIKAGDIVLVCGYGAGFTTGAMLFRWE